MQVEGFPAVERLVDALDEHKGLLMMSILPRILQEKTFNLKLSGDEVYYTA